MCSCQIDRWARSYKVFATGHLLVVGHSQTPLPTVVELAAPFHRSVSSPPVAVSTLTLQIAKNCRKWAQGTPHELRKLKDRLGTATLTNPGTQPRVGAGRATHTGLKTAWGGTKPGEEGLARGWGASEELPGLWSPLHRAPAARRHRHKMAAAGSWGVGGGARGAAAWGNGTRTGTETGAGRCWAGPVPSCHVLSRLLSSCLPPAPVRHRRRLLLLLLRLLGWWVGSPAEEVFPAAEPQHVPPPPPRPPQSATFPLPPAPPHVCTCRDSRDSRGGAAHWGERGWGRELGPARPGAAEGPLRL